MHGRGAVNELAGQATAYDASSTDQAGSEHQQSAGLWNCTELSIEVHACSGETRLLDDENQAIRTGASEAVADAVNADAVRHVRFALGVVRRRQEAIRHDLIRRRDAVEINIDRVVRHYIQGAGVQDTV